MKPLFSSYYECFMRWDEVAVSNSSKNNCLTYYPTNKFKYTFVWTTPEWLYVCERSDGKLTIWRYITKDINTIKIPTTTWEYVYVDKSTLEKLWMQVRR